MHLEPLPDTGSAVPPMGSLAQAARKQRLRSARFILIGIGILQIIVSLILISIIPSRVDEEIRELREQGHDVPRELRDQVIRTNRLLNSIPLAAGITFVVFGLAVYAKPVPITIASVIIYVGCNALFIFLEPSTITRGIILKIIIVVALVRAVQTAIAFEQERRRGSMPSFDSDAAATP